MKRQPTQPILSKQKVPIDTPLSKSNNQFHQTISKKEEQQKQVLKKKYYKEYFPFELLFTFFSRNGEYPTREYCYFENVHYIHRYQSYKDVTEFKESLLKIYKFERLDIGPIYEHLPFNSKQKELLKEFIIDIDITDYSNDIRFCCEDPSSFCNHCWILFVCASKVIQFFFQRKFGCKYILSVFSGGKGFHFWICDKMMMQLDESERSHICSFITDVLTGNEYDDGLHQEIFELLDPYFDKYSLDQQLFSNQERRYYLLKLFPEHIKREYLEYSQELANK